MSVWNTVYEWLFGEPPKTPSELLSEWRKEVRQSKRDLDRTLRDLALEEQKAKQSLKQNARRGDTVALRIIARGIVRSRAAADRIRVTNSQLDSIELQMVQQISQLKVFGAIQKSTTAMETMNRLVNAPELMGTMRKLSLEMQKAGFIGEMIESTLEEEEETEEEEITLEVDNVLQEIIGTDLISLTTNKKPIKQDEMIKETEEKILADRLELIKV